MNKIIVYIVGPLFTEGEVKQRLYEGSRIRDYLDSLNITYELHNPIEMPLNDDVNVTSSQIYQADYERLNQSNVVFFDLSNEDSGSCVALGIMLEKKLQGKDIRFYPVIHDIRLSRNGQSGLESSCGYNSMLIGCLKGNDIQIYSSFEQAYQQFIKDIK